jgi:hypothetical protein
MWVGKLHAPASLYQAKEAGTRWIVGYVDTRYGVKGL